jgi:hypothetical protein
MTKDGFLRLQTDPQRRAAHRTLKEVTRKLEEALRLSRILENRRREEPRKNG